MKSLLKIPRRRVGHFDLNTLQKPATINKKTKIVGSMGPASLHNHLIPQLISAGLNTFRLNFSHGTHETANEALKIIRNNHHILRPFGQPVLMDLKGPSIRTGMLEGGKEVKLKKGQKFVLCMDYNFKGNEEKVAVSYPKMVHQMNIEDNILLADGNLRVVVKDVDREKGELTTEVQNDFVLGERKNMNLPGKEIDIPTLTDKDKNDVAKFSIPNKIDIVSISFCRSAKDIKELRQLLGPRANKTRICAKIENLEGMQNLEEIIDETDVVMIARGDLGMEIPPEKVPVAQLLITNLCQKKRKPVITATQMLLSMKGNSRPTRAEITDVFLSVYSGSDSVMLSEETASGSFPLPAVKTMADICKSAEMCIDYNLEVSLLDSNLSKEERFCIENTIKACKHKIYIVVVISEDVNLARKLTFLESPAFVLAPHHDDEELRFNELFKSLYGVKINEADDKHTIWLKCKEVAENLKLVDKKENSKALIIDCKKQIIDVVSL